jgi:hypothetical protein
MAVSSHPEAMNVIAFIESRRASARALQGARGDDPVRPEAHRPLPKRRPGRARLRRLARLVPRPAR